MGPSILLGFVVAGVLVASCFFLHLAVLRRLARAVSPSRMRRPLLRVLFVIFALHMAETLLFALGFAFLELVGAGQLEGAHGSFWAWFGDHFYFSIASYTTLGLGDIVPHGGLRVVTGIEALAGLVLIAWSASFSYLMMERLWQWRQPGKDAVGE